MLPPPLLLLVCGFLVPSSTAGPLRPSRHDHGQPSEQQQQRLHETAHYSAGHKPKSNTHLDAAPNSVGVLFTTSDNGDLVSHAWLPLGKRVYTRDAPDLPLHPVTARITTMIRSSPQRASQEFLDGVVCDIHPRYNRTEDNQNPEAMIISISRSDGLVRLGDADVKAWREVESYECA